MSISLIGVIIGLPITLAIRGVMGKEKFNEWVNSLDYILETNFDSIEEMTKCVTAAGYDVIDWFGSWKTHLNKKTSSYFFWEIRDEKIIAKMSKYDDEKEIEQFIERVEKICNRKVFYEETKLKEVAEDNNRKINKLDFVDQFPTVYVDEDILIQILEQYGVTTESRQENKIVCKYQDYELEFTRLLKEEPYDLIIRASSKDMRAIHECINNLNGEYYATLQENAYWDIKHTIEEEGMEIEEEEVLEDNTIVLTVMV